MNWVGLTVAVGGGGAAQLFAGTHDQLRPSVSPGRQLVRNDWRQLIRAFPLLITRWLVNRLLAVMVLPTPVRTTPCSGSALL